MLNELKKRTKNEKGLTLIELLAVIVILAIIAAIAIPAIGNIISNSRDKAVLADSINIISGGKIAHMDGQCTDDKCNGAVLANYVDGMSATELAGVEVSITDNVWSIENPAITAINNDNLKPEPTSGDIYTEADIKEILGN